MKGRMNTNMGKIVVDTEVIAKYAGSSAVECFGIVGMASVGVKDGFARLLRKGKPCAWCGGYNRR